MEPSVKPQHSSKPSTPATPSIDRLPSSKRHKVLFIADSIGRNADVRHLEEATNTLIFTEKAYGAQYKTDALKPNKNFCYVSANVANKRDYKYAVLQGASTDVTNLDTANHNEVNIPVFQQEIFISSQNMISAAKSIVRNPLIEAVVILKRTPRFDVDYADPTGLKSKLSEYGNEVLRNQLKASKHSDKIVIGSHSLPNNLDASIYGNPDVRGYDGIHLYGPKGRNFYTRSVCNVLQNVFHKNARSLHNHTIPAVRGTRRNHPHTANEQTGASVPSSSYLPQSSNPLSSSRSDSVVIDIEYPHDQPLFYSVPTYNSFGVLGN